MKRICVFCGASSGLRDSYAEAASELGRLLARAGSGLVFGGGNVGLMGVIADAALGEGGEVIGVIPRSLLGKELAHEGLSEIHVVDSMLERKKLLADLSDAFIALPGGVGTLDELAEVMTGAQLGLHQKPIGILDVDGYFEPLISFFDRATAEGFIRPEHRRILIVDDDPARLLSRMGEPRELIPARWSERER